MDIVDKTQSDTLSIYIPRGVNKTKLRRKLAAVAASFGVGPGKLLIDIADGDMLIVPVDDYEHIQVATWLRQQTETIRAMSPAERRKLGRVEDWLRQQIDAIQAQDPNDIRDDTTLEDFLLHLLEQMGLAFERRHAKDDAG